MRKLVGKLLASYPCFTEYVKWFLSFRTVSNSSFYKRYALKKALERTAGFNNSDLVVCIENTLECNAGCIMCLHRNTRLSGSMAMPLYKKLIDGCAASGIKTVSFGVYGEPLKDPDLLERIEYARSRNLDYMLITNGSLMNDGLARKLFELGGLKEIRFSVNGLSKEVYEKVMQGLDRDETYKNIRNFLELRKSLKRTELTVTLSCVRTHAVAKELDELIKFWKGQEGVGRIYLLDLRDRSGALTGEGGIGKRGRLDKDGLWFPPCNELWSYLSVYYDGKVAPCCMDNNERTLIVGDLNTEPLGEILGGEPYNALRRAHRDNKRNEHDICGKCHYPAFWY